MDALQNLYGQVQQQQQQPRQQQWNFEQQDQWFNPQQQQRSNTPPPGFIQQQRRSMSPPDLFQRQRSMSPQYLQQQQQQRSMTPPEFLQQQRSMTPPEFLPQQRSMTPPGFIQPRSMTPPPSFQQQPRSVTPPPSFFQQQRSSNPFQQQAPQYLQQQQQAFFQQQQPSYPPSYPPQYQQQPEWQEQQFVPPPRPRPPSPSPPPQQYPRPQQTRPPAATRVSQAIVPEPSAIASTSATREQVHSTLTEPVSVTLARDAKRVANNLQQIVVFNSSRNDPARTLRDWDLWGPFFFVIAMSCILSSTATTNKSTVFAVVFAVLSAGAVSLTMNVVLLGGKLNFLQSLSVLGYCLFPLDVGAILCAAYSGKLYRTAMVLVTFLWSSWSVYPFVTTAVRPSRKALAVYPVFLMYISMGFLVLAND